MKVLIIGNGGRENALAWKIAKSPRVNKIYIAPGNGGLFPKCENIPIEVDKIDELLEFAKKEEISISIVGPELPLMLGIVNVFKEHGLRIFGPEKKAAILEGSKSFTKDFLFKYDIPTAKSATCRNTNEALAILKSSNYPLVIKADGLCAGKGVIIVNDEREAIETIEDIFDRQVFGKQESVVIEEFLIGDEASLICFVSGNKIFPLQSARDYKRIGEGNTGPNTGGVGCYSPSNILNEKTTLNINDKILKKVSLGLKNEGLEYSGILFIGLMIDKDEPKVLEFNVRFGDPETEVLMPRLESDLIELIEKSIDGTLVKEDIKWTSKKCLAIVLTSKGYPGDFEKGMEINGLENLKPEILLFHNGTKAEGNFLYTNGGRVLTISTLADSFKEARETIYSEINKIHFDGISYRKDIGIID